MRPRLERALALVPTTVLALRRLPTVPSAAKAQATLGELPHEQRQHASGGPTATAAPSNGVPPVLRGTSSFEAATGTRDSSWLDRFIRRLDCKSVGVKHGPLATLDPQMV